jgi:hypothetical protein
VPELQKKVLLSSATDMEGEKCHRGVDKGNTSCGCSHCDIQIKKCAAKPSRGKTRTMSHCQYLYGLHTSTDKCAAVACGNTRHAPIMSLDTAEGVFAVPSVLHLMLGEGNDVIDIIHALCMKADEFIAGNDEYAAVRQAATKRKELEGKREGITEATAHNKANIADFRKGYSRSWSLKLMRQRATNRPLGPDEQTFLQTMEHHETTVLRNTDLLAKIGDELQQLSQEHDRMEAEGQLGPSLQHFTCYMRKEIGAEATVYHGGKLEGNGINRFLGHTDKTRNVKTYDDALTSTQQFMRTKLGQVQCDVIDGVVNHGLRPQCGMLSNVCYVINSYADLTGHIDEAIACCTGYVKYYRETWAHKPNDDSTAHVTQAHFYCGGTRNVRPKLHMLETHVPEFLKQWGSTGIYSESVIEAYHAIANQRRRTFAASSHDMLQYLQQCDDADNRNLYVHANEEGLYLANQHK